MELQLKSVHNIDNRWPKYFHSNPITDRQSCAFSTFLKLWKLFTTFLWYKRIVKDISVHSLPQLYTLMLFLEKQERCENWSERLFLIEVITGCRTSGKSLLGEKHRSQSPNRVGKAPERVFLSISDTVISRSGKITGAIIDPRIGRWKFLTMLRRHAYSDRH